MNQYYFMPVSYSINLFEKQVWIKSNVFSLKVRAIYPEHYHVFLKFLAQIATKALFLFSICTPQIESNDVQSICYTSLPCSNPNILKSNSLDNPTLRYLFSSPFYVPPQKVARYYVIPSEISDVRPSALHNFVSTL